MRSNLRPGVRRRTATFTAPVGAQASVPASRRGKTSRRWVARVADVLVGLLAVGLVTSAVIVHVDHLRFEPVLSGSMRPGIQPGDVAVLRPVSVQQLRVGEVIAYLPPNETTPVMHRIVSLDAQGIVTKGDANSVADPWGRVKTRSATVEHLVAVVPNVGLLLQIRRQLLIAAGGVLLFAATLAIWTASRKPEPQEGDAESGDDEHAPMQSQQSA